MAFLYREYVEFVPCVAQLFRIFARGKSDVIFRYLILGFDLASTWLRYGFAQNLSSCQPARKNNGLFHPMSARFYRTPFP